MPKRIETLQSLRAIAIFAVFVSHCGFISNSQGDALFNWTGAMGVSIFFCLSGFLAYVTSIGLKQPHGFEEIRSMVAHKIRKFYPLHILTFVFAMPFVVWAVLKGGSALSELIKGVFNIALVQSWIPLKGVYFSFNGVSWFLSTYLLMIVATPVLIRTLVLLKSKDAGRLVTCGLIAICFMAEVALCALFGETAPSHWILYICPPVRLIDFFAGMLIGMLYQEARTSEASSFKKIVMGGGASVLPSTAFLWRLRLRYQRCRISSFLQLGSFLHFSSSRCSLFLTIHRALRCEQSPLSFSAA